MKKIIVAICGILITIGSFAKPGRYKTPDGTSNFGDAWHFRENATYNVDIGTSFYSDLSSQICHGEANDCVKKVTAGGGTENDEKAIVLDIAREIYRNGAKFCTTQIQAANANGYPDWTWIDYYTNSNYDNKCRVYCKPGYDPDNKCDTKLSEEKCDDPDYGMFNEHKIITSGTRFTEDMSVFSVDNETGTDNSDTATHVVLGIIKKDESGNGVLVAPVQIVGKHGGAPIQSWIYSASYQESLSAITVLCPQGFQADDSNKKCVLTPKCKQEQQDAENDALQWCNGYVHYNESEHKIKVNENVSPKCRYYRCKETGYGFEEGTEHKCVPCGETKKSGLLDDGVCKVCNMGYLFDKNVTGGCKLATKIPKEKMQECFMYTDADEFKSCVMRE